MTSTPTRPVDNVVIATKGLQDRNIYIIAGTTVENKGKNFREKSRRQQELIIDALHTRQLCGNTSSSPGPSTKKKSGLKIIMIGKFLYNFVNKLFRMTL